jgi:uncharacterized protein
MAQVLSEPFLLLTVGLMAISLVVMLVIPIFPGQFVIWLAALVYGLVAGWERLGWPVFVVITGAMIVAAVIDFFLGALGARAGGASVWGIAGGLALGLVGLVFVNALGAIVGVVLGLLAIEWYRQQDLSRAWKASRGYLAGLLGSVVIRFVIALIMVAVFLWKVL